MTGDLVLKATGIVRRIDALGRMVIPKEIRRTLRISEGDPLEIYTNADGSIVFKKYSRIAQLNSFAREYVQSLTQTLDNKTILVCDKDIILSSSKKFFNEKKISLELETIINSLAVLSSSRGEKNFVNILDGQDNDNLYEHELITPIVNQGDATGALIILSQDKKSGELENKLSRVGALFLSKLIL